MINAGDSTAMALLSRPRVRAWRKEIALCALSAGDLKECLELELGGCSYLAEDGSIVEAMGGAVRNIAPLSAVPTTLGGRAAFQTMNALLAVAASRGLGLEAGEVARHISTFGRDGADDGIFTLYRVKAGHVILDRGGNALGYRAVSDALDGLDASRRTCVVAGSRKLVEPEAEVLARRFHKIIIHDGREGGGKSRELTRKRPDCRIVTGEAAALATALGEMMEGEVVVHFYTDMTIAKEVLREFGAQRTELLASNDFLSGLRAMNADLFAS